MEWIRAELCCLLMILSSCLGNVDPEDVSLDIQKEFIASNAVRVSVCLEKREPRPNIQDLTFKLTRDNIPLEVEQVHLKSEKKVDKACELETLWFEPVQHDESLDMEVSYTLSNASRQSTIRKSKVITLTRTSLMIPTVKMVKITMVKVGFEDIIEHMEIPGPAYNSTVPPTIPFLNDGVDPDRFTMECVVEGTTDENVKWYQNGNVLLTGKTMETSDAGVYWCGVSTEYGTAISHHIDLKIASIQPFSSGHQLQELTVIRGNGVKLKCDPLPYCFPDCRVEWSVHVPRRDWYDRVHIDNITTFTPEDGSLVIKKTDDSHNKTYRCNLNLPFIDRTEFGYKTKLKVINGRRHDLTPLHRPAETVHAREGQTLSLYCIFAGERKNRWFRNSELLKTSNILKFDAITVEDSGTYTCRPDRASQTESYNTYVRVEAKPVINEGRNLNTLNAVVNRNATIICNSSGTPTPDITISLATINGADSVQKPIHGGVAMEIKKIHDYNTGIVYCNASNFLGYSFAATSLEVFDPVEVMGVESSASDKPVSPNSPTVAVRRYICNVKTDPRRRLKITWIKDGEVLYNNQRDGIIVQHHLLELNQKTKIEGYYSCEATDGLSSAKKGFPISSSDGQTARSMDQPDGSLSSMNRLYIVLCGIIGGVVIVVVITIVVGVRTTYRSKSPNQYSTYPRSRLSTMSDGTVGSGMPHETDPMFPPATIIENFHQDQGGHLPVKDPSLRNTVYEVYIDRSRINMNELIGKGQFGRVYLAQLKSDNAGEGRKVAVKTLKYKADETEIVECFLKEAVIMKNFTNPHVLSLIGISFEIDGSPMVVLPYMANGDLRDFIQDPDRDITVLELLKLGLQVGKGMSYLQLRKYVHRDLACRNCMVAESSTVKVADFGLSRDLFSRDYYREASGKRPLPVRWMAPECHHSNVFTTLSDVWSFGVLLWELMTRGAVPYPNIENWNVSAHVVAGNILPQPNYCPNSVYKIMLSCWNTKPEDRTPFPQLVHDIEDIIHSANEGQEDCQSLYLNIQRCEEVDYRSTTTV